MPHDPDGAGPLPPLPFETQVVESHTGSIFVTLDVSLEKRSGKTVAVTYSTATGTAAESVFSGQTSELPDYEATPQEDLPGHQIELVFAPGETAKSFTVEVFGDNRVEPDEQFYVNLLSANNAIIAAHPTEESNHVTIEIENDDTTPGVDFGPYSVRFSDAVYLVDEPASGSAEAEITIVRTAD